MDPQGIDSLADLALLAAALADGLGTHISIYLSIISAYLICSYLVADKLTTLQVSIATGVYLVAYVFQALILVAYVRRIGLVFDRIEEFNLQQAGFAEAMGVSYIGFVVLTAGLVAPLWFMWSVRRGDSR